MGILKGAAFLSVVWAGVLGGGGVVGHGGFWGCAPACAVSVGVSRSRGKGCAAGGTQQATRRMHTLACTHTHTLLRTLTLMAMCAGWGLRQVGVECPQREFDEEQSNLGTVLAMSKAQVKALEAAQRVQRQ